MATTKWAGHNVAPGEKLFTSVTVDCRHDRITFPLFMVGGAQAGKTLFIISGEHGTELVGPESIRRFIEGLDPQGLTGTVVAVPVANPLAMRSKQHTYPYDRGVWWAGAGAADMSRAWESPEGDAQIDHLVNFLRGQFVEHADALISLHDTNFAPYMGFVSSDEVGKAMCLDYGRIAEIRATARPGGCVRNAWERYKIPGMLIEWPPLRYMNQAAVEQNVLGLNNVLKTLGMQAGTPRKIADQFLIDATVEGRRGELVKAVDDGLLVRRVAWGQNVRAGEIIAELYDLYRYRKVQDIVAPIDGIVRNTGPSPDHQCTFFFHCDSVCCGEVVATVATYDEHIVNQGGDSWHHLLLGLL